jgi:hypothetical protein
MTMRSLASVLRPVERMIDLIEAATDGALDGV